MDEEVEHLGNDLGIDGESSSSSSSDVNVSISSDSSKESEERFAAPSLTPKIDKWAKRSYQSTSMDKFFVMLPKLSSSSLPQTIAVIDNEPLGSSRNVKQWIDPRKQKDKKRRRLAEHKRRSTQKSDRHSRVLGNFIDLEAARSGADLTQAEARASIVEEVIAKLNPPKKKKTAMVEDDSVHLRSKNQYLLKSYIMARYRRQANEFSLLIKHCFSSRHFANTTAPIRTKKKTLMLSERSLRKEERNVNGVSLQSELRERIKKNMGRSILPVLYQGKLSGSARRLPT
jgi:hypothetical protein